MQGVYCGEGGMIHESKPAMQQRQRRQERRAQAALRYETLGPRLRLQWSEAHQGALVAQSALTLEQSPISTLKVNPGPRPVAGFSQADPSRQLSALQPLPPA